MIMLHMNMYGVMLIGVEEEYESKVSVYVRHCFPFIDNCIVSSLKTPCKVSDLSDTDKENHEKVGSV